MLKSATFVTIAAALLVGCGDKPPEVAESGGSDVEKALTRICQTQTIYKDEATCRAEETKAMQDLENFGSVPKEIADRCLAPPNIDRYSTVLACVRAAMPQLVEDEPAEKPVPKGMVRYSGDYGCETYQDQVNRMAALKIVMQASMLKAQGQESRESKALSDVAAKRLVDISKTKCRPLDGDFKAISRRKITGGEAVQIQFDQKTKLWVLGS